MQIFMFHLKVFHVSYILGSMDTTLLTSELVGGVRVIWPFLNHDVTMMANNPICGSMDVPWILYIPERHIRMIYIVT